MSNTMHTYIPTVTIVGNGTATTYQNEGWTWFGDAIRGLYKMAEREIRKTLTAEGKTETDIQPEVDCVLSEIKDNRGLDTEWICKDTTYVFCLLSVYNHDSKAEASERRRKTV